MRQSPSSCRARAPSTCSCGMITTDEIRQYVLELVGEALRGQSGVEEMTSGEGSFLAERQPSATARTGASPFAMASQPSPALPDRKTQPSSVPMTTVRPPGGETAGIEVVGEPFGE